MDKRLKTVQRHYKCYQDGRVRNPPKNIDFGDYDYLDRPLMTTNVAQCLATKSYNQLLTVKNGLYRVIRMTPTTVTTDEDIIRNTVTEDLATKR